MAYTATSIFKSTMGNKRVRVLTITADAASGAFDTGLSRVEAAFPCPVSCATAAFKVIINKNSAGTALNGSIFISSAAANDGFTIIAFGV